MENVDVLILSNGPGEITTWVRPVVRELRRKLGKDPSKLRISVILSPCPNASGKEAAIANSYPEVDRTQDAKHFLRFLVWGKTEQNWQWRKKGIVIFLGGDQFFAAIIGKRLGYRTIVYAEWEARWHNLIDRFGVMKAEVSAKIDPKYADKFTVVGDLMQEANSDLSFSHEKDKFANQKVKAKEIIAFLPGSKAAKLTQGVPLSLAIAEYIHRKRPQTEFILPVAPTLDLETLESFANPEKNPFTKIFGDVSAKILNHEPKIIVETSSEINSEINSEFRPEINLEKPKLKTANCVTIELWNQHPAYEILSQCQICLTTVGANTAEIGSLAIPMIVLLPTQQLDAMRSWDGVPGILANLPFIGSSIAKTINWFFLRKKGLLAWPNIWAGKEVVPELVGKLQPEEIGEMVLDYLENPEKLAQMRSQLQSIRGEAGAAAKLANMVEEEIEKLGIGD
ncbi:glycosyltransferase family protein [Mastigocoleus testarum]|uniref:Lipid-A-disaccharide synthase n=1 Tax=Mastigocoleus testarum BC008 TaxID=371196 RepID=A0A0V7ZNU6_9CYAN|nr:hypothetical protein [Mastigocoleus testarum]KST66139.1 lipid-A-disaccharide synthase [Mastigocoleus testarum BC008]